MLDLGELFDWKDMEILSEAVSTSGKDPTVSIEQPPEPKRGIGRPKGSTQSAVRSAAVRLRQLNFDPVEKLVGLYERIERELAEMEKLKNCPVVLANGDTRRFSNMTYSSLVATQQKLVNDLMRYGYARVSETVQVEEKTKTSLVINLTPKGGKFVPNDDEIDFTMLSEETD